MMDITEVPQVPAHVKGVLNLRGKVIPVIDLRLKFGFAQGEVTARTCIIVVEVALAVQPRDDGHHRGPRVRGAEHRGRRDRADAGVRRPRLHRLHEGRRQGQRARSRSCSISIACSGPTMRRCALPRTRRWAPTRVRRRERCASPTPSSRRSSGSSTSAPASRCTAGSGRSCSRACRSGCARAASRASATTWRTSKRDQSGAEITALLDAIATNHTSFFREPQHFEFLRSTVVPALVQKAPMRIWSAACSSGEEPVTIAITLLDALRSRVTSRAFGSWRRTSRPRRSRIASSGVYKMERVAGIPLDTLRRHFERGLGAQAGQARVAAACAASSSSTASSTSSRPAISASGST